MAGNWDPASLVLRLCDENFSSLEPTNMKLKLLVLPALLSLFLAIAGRAQIVSTVPGWNGTTGVSSFGNTGPANSGFPLIL